MKNLKYFLCLFLLGFLFTAVKAQEKNDESLGLPGDNLNLYAVLKLFQESETLEGFEKSLNDENTHINNLDLDGDNNIDYIKVQDNVDGDVHTIVLQVAVTPHENQDVAVFTVQRDANNQVQVQLIGDDELYGKDYIIEPNYEGDNASQTPNPGYNGNAQAIDGKTVVVNRTTYVEIAAWPVVRYIYTPSYVVWYSPWYYGYYPPYWSTWRPYYWHSYYGYHHNYNHYYYGNYRRGSYYRYSHWNDNYYSNRRSHSQVVYQRRQAGDYRNTYSRPETRKEGTEIYRKTHKEYNTRPGNKPTGRPGISKPAVRPGINNPSTRPGVNKPSARPDVNKPATRPGGKDKSTRPGVNNSKSRPNVIRHSGKPVEKRPASRSGNSKPSAKPDRSSSKGKTDNGRK